MDQHFLNTYEPVCNTLSDFGWFVAPFLIQWEFDELQKLCNKIRSENLIDSEKKEKYSSKINEILKETSFQPNYRAFFIYRSKEVPHVSEYSHLYERSIYHYYKHDYISCILILIPVIEGVLLSYYGWAIDNEERKPSLKQLLSKLKNERISNHHEDINHLFSIYGRVMAEFLEKWIYSDTSSSDFSNSWLNRHVLLHGMVPGNFNKQIEANRLIIFFDLMISYFTILINKFYIFIPSDNDQIDERCDYIILLQALDVSQAYCIKQEEKFMKDNKNYKSPENIYKLSDSIKRNKKKLNQIRGEFNK